MIPNSRPARNPKNIQVVLMGTFILCLNTNKIVPYIKSIRDASLMFLVLVLESTTVWTLSPLQYDTIAISAISQVMVIISSQTCSSRRK